jgi:hypothetical protein
LLLVTPTGVSILYLSFVCFTLMAAQNGGYRGRVCTHGVATSFRSYPHPVDKTSLMSYSLPINWVCTISLLCNTLRLHDLFLFDHRYLRRSCRIWTLASACGYMHAQTVHCVHPTSYLDWCVGALTNVFNAYPPLAHPAVRVCVISHQLN